jgi:hypothetical protein
MSAGDRIALDYIQGNALSSIQQLQRDMATQQARVLSLDRLDAATNDSGEMTQGGYSYRDDDGNLRLALSGNDLFDELGVHANFAGVAADGVTPTVWIDADTGELMAVGGGIKLGEDALYINSDGDPFIIFQNEAGTTEIMRMFHDGAGNFQFDLVDPTKGFTFNDGNVICGHAAGVDSGFYLHENYTAKARLWWDASATNLILENLVNSGNMVAALKGYAVDTERFSVYDSTLGYGKHRFYLNGSHHMRLAAALPPNPDAHYGMLVPLADGTLHWVLSDGTDTQLGAGGGGDASVVTYTPTTPADWDVEPDYVDEGLDELAGRVTTLEDAGGATTLDYDELHAMLG